MVWVRLDDEFHANKKVGDLAPTPPADLDAETLDVTLPLAAIGLHTLALSWCGKFLTDGKLPRRQPARLAGGPVDNLVADLIRVGLWKTSGPGYEIHDFLDYNPSAAQAKTLSKVRSDSGRRGAQSRWGSGIDGNGHGNGHGNGYGKPIANAWQTDAPEPVSPFSIEKNKGKDRRLDPVENPGSDRPKTTGEFTSLGAEFVALGIVPPTPEEVRAEPADDFRAIDLGSAR